MWRWAIRIVPNNYFVFIDPDFHLNTARYYYRTSVPIYRYVDPSTIQSFQNSRICDIGPKIRNLYYYKKTILKTCAAADEVSGESLRILKMKTRIILLLLGKEGIHNK